MVFNYNIHIFLSEIKAYIFRNRLNRSILKKLFYCGKNVKIYTPIMWNNYNQISIGDNTTIFQNSRLQVFQSNNIDKPSIKIGTNCYIALNFTCLSGGINNDGSIIIGNYVTIASYVLICSFNHIIDIESKECYRSDVLKCKSIYIGDNCWIGEKVSILKGVKIGKKCIIGANSVVTKDVPDYCVAAGNPAQILKVWNFNLHKYVKYDEDRK